MDLLLEPFSVFPLLRDVFPHAEKKSDKFETTMHLGPYSPDEVVVKVADNVITVRAEHEEKSKDGYSCSRTVRQITAPENTRVDQLKSYLTNSGDLVLEAPLEKRQAVEGVRDIPIAIEGPEKAADGDKKQAQKKGQKK